MQCSNDDGSVGTRMGLGREGPHVQALGAEDVKHQHHHHDQKPLHVPSIV